MNKNKQNNQNFGEQVKFVKDFELICARVLTKTDAVRSGKKSPNQEIGLENRGRLKVLNDSKLVLNEHE